MDQWSIGPRVNDITIKSFELIIVTLGSKDKMVISYYLGEGIF
jgi:hypothetical protein